MKETILHSVHITFDENGVADAQLQHIERLTVDGEVVRTLYLPHERLSLVTASAEDKAKLKAALGAVGLRHAEQAQRFRAELEAAVTAHTEAESAWAQERQGLAAQVEALMVQVATLQTPEPDALPEPEGGVTA